MASVLTPGQALHRRYIASAEWAASRRRWWAGCPPWRRRCRARSVLCHGGTQLHHRTYVRAYIATGVFRPLGQERRRDLVPLCDRHHKQLHRYQHARHLSVERASELFLRAALARRWAVVLFGLLILLVML